VNVTTALDTVAGSMQVLNRMRMLPPIAAPLWFGAGVELVTWRVVAGASGHVAGGAEPPEEDEPLHASVAASSAAAKRREARGAFGSMFPPVERDVRAAHTRSVTTTGGEHLRRGMSRRRRTHLETRARRPASRAERRADEPRMDR